MKAARTVRTLSKPVLVICAVLLVVCGCSEDKVEVENKVKTTKNLFSYVPEGDYLSLGFADIQNLMENEWAAELFRFYPALRVWDEKLGLSLDRFQNFAMAIRCGEQLGSEPEILIVMQSDLDEDEILEIIGERRQYFEEKKIGKRVFYSSGEEFSFGIINDDIVVLGTPALVENSLRVANGDVKSMEDEGQLERYESYFRHNDDFWMTIQGITAILRQQDGYAAIPPGLRNIDFGYIGLTVRDGLSGRFIGEAPDDESAGKLAASLNTIKGIAKSLSKGIVHLDEDLSSTGVEPQELQKMFEEFIDNTRITNEKKQVIISYTFPDELLDFFLDQVKYNLDREDFQISASDGIGK